MKCRMYRLGDQRGESEMRMEFTTVRDNFDEDELVTESEGDYG